MGLGAQSESASEQESEFGNGLAVGAGLTAAAYLNVVRHAGKTLPRVMLMSATPFASVIATLVGLIATQGNVASECMPRSGIAGWAFSITSGAVIMPLSTAAFAYGS